MNTVKLNQEPTQPSPSVNHATSSSTKKAASDSHSVSYHGLVDDDTSESPLAEQYKQP